MRSLRCISVLIVVLMLISVHLYAQESEFGVNIGFGKTSTDENGRKFVLPFDNDLANFYRLGVFYSYTPKHTILSVVTGIYYDYKGRNDQNLNYFRVPLGLDFNFGKKVSFILGGGLFASYLFAYKINYYNTDFEDTKRRFQLGWYGNLGIGVQISQKYNLNIKYQYNADISKMFENQRSSHGGSPYKVDVKSFDGFIVLSLKYKVQGAGF